MDRTVGNGSLATERTDGSAASDPFKQRLARDNRKRHEARDPRIQAPRTDLFGPAAPSSAAMDIVGRPPTAASRLEAKPDPRPEPKPDPKPAPGPPRPEATLGATSSGAAVPTRSAGILADPIIAPGEVFADPALTELVQQKDGSFTLARDRKRKADPLAAILKPAGLGAAAGGTALQPQAGLRDAKPPGRLSIKALAPASSTAAVRPRAERAATIVPDDRQDDIAAGALATVVLLLAGWMGFQILGAPKAAAPALAPDPGPLASIASAPALPAPALADASAGAPLDLTPSTPVAPSSTGLATPAMAAQSMPMSPARFASYSVSASLAAAAAATLAPASEAAPALPVSCDPNLVTRAYFCTAQTSLTVSARAMLERELAQLQACANGREIVVTGYADTRGLASRNAALSEGRAEAVASFLRGKGLAVVTVAGAGEASGLTDDRNCPHQRRVDISFGGASPPASLSCAVPASAAAMSCG